MSRKTIKGELLEWWKGVGDIAYSDAAGKYLNLAWQVRRSTPSPDFLGMTLTRILKQNGHKLGPAGSKAKWRFGPEPHVFTKAVTKKEEEKVEEKKELTMMDMMREMLREIVMEEMKKFNSSDRDVMREIVREELRDAETNLTRDQVIEIVQDQLEDHDYTYEVERSLSDIDLADYVDFDEIAERCDVETRVNDALAELSPDCSNVQEVIKSVIVNALS